LYTGGKGAFIQGVFNFTRGSVLSILVGQTPDPCGGGGGSFVALGFQYTRAVPLLVAGGGGGANYDYSVHGVGGQSSQLGTGLYPYLPGCGATRAPCGGGGGGFFTGWYARLFCSQLAYLLWRLVAQRSNDLFQFLQTDPEIPPIC
jgi:hypothetical protein